jgi:hypothetical protein
MMEHFNFLCYDPGRKVALISNGIRKAPPICHCTAEKGQDDTLGYGTLGRSKKLCVSLASSLPESGT